MTVSRKNISTETPWEQIFGYSRIVRIGPYVYVSGTTATDKSGSVVGIGNPYMQSIQIIINIQTALQRVDASLTDMFELGYIPLTLSIGKKLDKLI
jgi:enamine deaminase RidA (YjgF/YER057c/UK114 family)